jgi:hypothetical protein
MMADPNLQNNEQQEQPESQWRRIYVLVSIFTLIVYSALWLFSETFS